MLTEVSNVRSSTNPQEFARELRAYLLGIYANSNVLRTIENSLRTTEGDFNIEYDTRLKVTVESWIQNLRFPPADSVVLVPFILSNALMCYVQDYFLIHGIRIGYWTIVTGIDRSAELGKAHLVFLLNDCNVISIKITFSDMVRYPNITAYCGTYGTIGSNLRNQIISLYVKQQILYEGIKMGHFQTGTRTTFDDYLNILCRLYCVQKTLLEDVYGGYDIVTAQVVLEDQSSKPILIGCNYPLVGVEHMCLVTVSINYIGFDVTAAEINGNKITGL